LTDGRFIAIYTQKGQFSKKMKKTLACFGDFESFRLVRPGGRGCGGGRRRDRRGPPPPPRPPGRWGLLKAVHFKGASSPNPLRGLLCQRKRRKNMQFPLRRSFRCAALTCSLLQCLFSSKMEKRHWLVLGNLLTFSFNFQTGKIFRKKASSPNPLRGLLC
jgi:hypothetical protein